MLIHRILFFLILFLYSILAADFGSDNNNNEDSTKKIILASFYTVHQAGAFPCDVIVPENIILTIIHSYAASIANERILSKLGFQLVSNFADTCDSTSISLQQAVGIIGKSHSFSQSPSSSFQNTCKGAISDLGSASNDSFLVAGTGVFRGEIGDSINYLFTAFCLPILASGESSAEMDNAFNYPYFLRTGASDIYKIQVIFDLLQSQQWYHIAVIYDSSSTGQALTNQLKTLVSYCNTDDLSKVFRAICIENYFQLSFFDDSSEYELQTQRKNLAQYLNATTTRVIVILMEDRAIDKTLLFIKSLGWNPGRWQFVLSSKNLQSVDLLEYAFAVQEDVQEFPHLEEFLNKTSFENIDTIPSSIRPWVEELIENQNVCCWSNSTSCAYSIQCSGTEKIIYIPDKAKDEAMHVYNAIMLLATAIENIHFDFCENSTGFCENLMTHVHGETLFKYLLHAHFLNEFNYEFSLFNRSSSPIFNVLQMQKGTWQIVNHRYNPYIGPLPSEFNLPILEIEDFDGIVNESSLCQPDCFQSIIDMRGRCCWNCRSCGFGEYVNTSLMMCQNCSLNEMPNVNVTGCVIEPLPPIFYEPTAEMWVLIGVSGIGIIATFTLALYIYNFRKTPMVRASTPDLCYLQSLTQCLLFVISVMMLPSPNMIICGSVWTVSTILLVVTHAIFLIKAIRLSRPKFYTKLISYANTPVKCSMIMLSTITVSQTLISVIWILLRPPTPQRKLHEEIIHCSSNNEVQTIVLMIVPLGLIIGTFYFQRNAIRNKIMFQVRQARIGLAGSLCFIANYAVLLPLIFMEGSPAYVRATILMCIPLLTALVSLTTMHLPISYELFFRQTQNSHEYVSRERSRQFQAGNFVYYVDAMLLRRANRTRTQTTVNSSV